MIGSFIVVFIFVFILIAFAALSTRFGVDSREDSPDAHRSEYPVSIS
jgi:hypothetical protein